MTTSELYSVLFILIFVSASIIIFVNSFNKLSLRTIEAEENEIQNDEIRLNFGDKKVNIIDLMLKNVSELREYYIISKNQARRAFSAAVFISFLGIIIYIVGIIAVIYLESDVAIISTIGGTVVQVISGISYWLYNRSIKQLNMYYKKLVSTEKYLTVIQLIDKTPKDIRYEEYRNIINYILNDAQVELIQSNVVGE